MNILQPTVLAVVCAVLSHCGSGSSASTSSSSGGSGGDATSAGDLAACSDTAPFTVAPLAADAYTAIVPLGNLNPTGHTFPTNHLYLYLKTDDIGVSQTTPLYAPGDLRITAISASTYTSATPPYTDYQLYFSPCRDLQVYFLHVSGLSDTINAQLGDASDCTDYTTGGTSVHFCSYRLALDIAAGTQLGTAGGNPGQRALDFGGSDARITALPFAATRYQSSSDGLDQYHVICPLDYFTTELQATLQSRLGRYDGTTLRTVEPRCGEVEQDEPGTAQGIWFVNGTTSFQQEDPHLALVHDNIDPTLGAFSVGASIPSLSSGAYFFTPTHSGTVNRDFDEVTNDGNTYCYDSFQNYVGESIASQFVILLRLTTTTTLQIESQSGATCGSNSWTLGSGAVTFER
ncbi:MAG: hypothetical protein HY696_09495 [Deltaproteobacteria bacterium]|nr:hypothetical protein [Deltaproteobacteria bacterium]